MVDNCISVRVCAWFCLIVLFSFIPCLYFYSYVVHLISMLFMLYALMILPMFNKQKTLILLVIKM